MTKATDVSDNLYNELRELTDSDEGFYFVEQTVGEEKYHVFSYRLVPFTKFELPSALNCRGTTFHVSRPVPELVSLPPHKFFNLHEGSYDEVIDYDDVEAIMDKEDGSLISTYYKPDWSIGFKSKTSFKSDMAIAAQQYYEDNKAFAYHINNLTTQFNCTVNMEWVSPSNQIVVPYKESKLVIFNIRDNDTGAYLPPNMNNTSSFWVNTFLPDDVEGFVKSIPLMTSDEAEPVIEGFVVRLKNGDMKKIKTGRYVRLHHTKNDISNNKALFKIVLNQEHDDLRALLASDPISIDRINQMEAFAMPFYNGFMAEIWTFLDKNDKRKQKDFAILARGTLTNLQFSVIMSIYNKKNIDAIAFLCKNVDKIIGEYIYVPLH